MEAGESLLTIINEILDFSKIEAGRMQLELDSFELREMLGTALKSLGVRAYRKGIELIWQCQDDVPTWIVGDATRLRQILFNLVGNAIKFTNEGEVLLSVRKVASSATSLELEFSVIDSGIGIADVHHEKIFDAFEQADTSTTRRYGGTGLGLAISRRLVQLMGGDIEVESELGKGSTFRFRATFGEDMNHAEETVLDTAQFQTTSILVVDDNATNRRILVEVLTGWGLAVHAVDSGQAALEYLHALLQTSPPRPMPVLLTDYNMPEMDGGMLCSQVRSDSRLAGTKIIVLSSSVGVSQNEFGNLDIAAFLYKPIKQSELFNALANTVATKITLPHSPLPEAESMPALNVLLAEDGVANQKLAIGLLKRWGHTVTVVENGSEAVNTWANGGFDVILMDVQMPVMDGLEATQTIRSKEAGTNHHVPIIAVTAHAMTGDRDKCVAAGMDGYVTKPFKKQALYEALRPLVQK
jgi:CheY-like chemotaxis protein